MPQRLFDILVARSEPFTDEQTLWDEERQADVPVSKVPGAASLVVARRIPPFHVLFRGIRMGAIRLPDLGAFFFDDELALDYRGGAQWSSPVLSGFADLLGELMREAPGVEVDLEDYALPEVRQIFRLAVRDYVSGR